MNSGTDGDMDSDTANSEMSEYWNDRAGPNWVNFQQQLDGQIRILGEKAMDQAAIKAGQKVLDIGCGCRDSALELARRVDLSAPMLDHARQRAGLEPALNLDFEQVDAQTSEFPPAAYDHIFSRFGVMFFDQPVAAFGNMRGALKATGRLSFVCWRALDENPWMSIGIEVALQFVAPPDPIPPGAPGPFALAAPNRAREILEQAGYSDISVAPLDQGIYLSGPGTVAEAAALTCHLGPVARVLADADADTKRAVEEALVTTFTPYHDGTGVRMASACWIVSAGTK